MSAEIGLGKIIIFVEIWSGAIVILVIIANQFRWWEIKYASPVTEVSGQMPNLH